MSNQDTTLSSAAAGQAKSPKRRVLRPRKRSRDQRRAHVKLQIDLSNGSRLGPGKIRLLELVEAEGSLSRAAEAMGISYRRAWLFVQHVNASFDQPAVSTPEHGRGGAAAQLTDFGRELITRFRTLERLADAQGTDLLSWLDEHVHRTQGPRRS